MKRPGGGGGGGHSNAVLVYICMFVKNEMFLARREEIRDPHLDVIFVGQRVFPGGGGVT